MIEIATVIVTVLMMNRAARVVVATITITTTGTAMEEVHLLRNVNVNVTVVIETITMATPRVIVVITMLTMIDMEVTMTLTAILATAEGARAPDHDRASEGTAAEATGTAIANHLLPRIIAGKVDATIIEQQQAAAVEGIIESAVAHSTATAVREADPFHEKRKKKKMTKNRAITKVPVPVEVRIEPAEADLFPPPAWIIPIQEQKRKK